MVVLTAATVTLSGRVVGLKLGGLARAVAPPLAAALVMAGGVAVLLAALPEGLPLLLALVLAVPLGMALYGGALHAIAPDRLAEALAFARNRGDAETAPSPASAPAPAE
jgi:hypothetical protein